MADDIEFHLKTTGDPSGAQAVEKSIFKAEDAAKQASRQADVDIAKGRQLAEVEREQAAALQEIADGQQRIVAANLADSIGKLSSQFSGLSPEVDLALRGTQNFLNVFATTGNPIAATFALAGSAVSDVMTAYRGAAAEAKELSKQEQADVQKLIEFRQRLAAQLRAENLAAFYERETTALNKQADAIERMDRIRNARNEAAAAVEGAFGVPQSRQQEIQGQLDRTLADLAARVTKAEELAKVASTQAALADSVAQTTATNEGEKSPEAVAAAKAAEQARAAAETAQANVEEVRAITEADKQKALAAAATQTQEVIQEFEEQITEQATRVRDAIQRTADEKGGALDADIKGAFDTIVKLLGDSIPNSQQQAQLIQAMQQAAGSRDAVNNDLSSYFRESAAFQQATLNEIRSFRAQVTGFREQLGQ